MAEPRPKTRSYDKEKELTIARGAWLTRDIQGGWELTMARGAWLTWGMQGAWGSYIDL